MKFRAKVHGRISFVFSKCQMRRNIRACEGTFSPSTEIWAKATPAIQPNTPNVCPALSKRRDVRASHHPPGLTWPRLLLEGQVPALLKLRVPPRSSLSCTRHRTTAGGRDGLSTRLRGYSSPMGLVGIAAAFYIANLSFSAKTRACGRRKRRAFWILSFLKSLGSMWLMSFEEVSRDFFFFLLVNIFMFFFT